ncbi:MAG: hypothetical protein SGPRY_012655 [Prymnesium sp.]
MSPRMAWLLLALSRLEALRWGRSSSEESGESALSDAIAAQAQRIAALEKQLGRLSAQTCATPEPRGACAAHEEAIAWERQEPVELLPFRLQERRRAWQRQRELLSTLFNVTVGAPVTALAISTHLVEKGLPRFIMCADSTGSLHVFDREGKLLFSQPTDLDGARITAISIGTKEEPIVATAATDGQIRMYNMTLPRPARPVRSAKKGQDPLPTSPAVEFELTAALTIPSETVNGSPIAIGSLELVLRGRRLLLLLGDAGGRIRTLHRNGTMRQAVSLGPEVTAMTRNGNQLAVATADARLSLLEMNKFADEPLVCAADSEDVEFESSSIVSLAFDAHLTQLLFASTAAGELRVYNTKARMRPPGGGKTSVVCKLVHSIKGHAASPVSLAAMKGFLLLVFLESKMQWKADDSRDGMPDMLSFFRNPMIIGLIMVLIFWQSSKHFNKANEGSINGFMKQDFRGLDPAMLRNLEKSQARGRSGMGIADGDFDKRFEELGS